MGGGIGGQRSTTQARVIWYSTQKPSLKISRILDAGDIVSIGRGADQKIMLDDDLVSRNHARLQISDGAVLFEDLGSTNGCLLNGTQRITRLNWRPGQRIHMGSYILEVDFVAASAAPKQVAPSPIDRVDAPDSRIGTSHRTDPKTR